MRWWLAAGIVGALVGLLVRPWSGGWSTPIVHGGDTLSVLAMFRDAGLTEIALCIYSNPEQAIRTLGEYVVPALR